MQDRYSGDVGDFGKFGLLRHLINGSQLKFGINWYLFPDEGHNADGRFIHYLSQPAFERCDRELYNKLRQVVVSQCRSTRSLERADLFEEPPLFFSDPVDFYTSYPGNKRKDKEKRLAMRLEWKMNAISALSSADVIFLDPDNGLQVKSCCSLSQKKSGKFAYYDEILEFHAQKKLTIIYHHLNRHKNHGTHSNQIQECARELKSKINSKYRVFGIRYRPYSPRAFFMIVDPSVEKYIKKQLASFVVSNWQEYWDNLHAE